MLKVMVPLMGIAAAALLPVLAWASYDVTGSSVASLFYTGGHAPGECPEASPDDDAGATGGTEVDGDEGRDEDDCDDDEQDDDTENDIVDIVAGVDECEGDGGSDTTTDCELGSTGPVEGPEEAGTDPVETVRAFYLRLTEGTWSLLRSNGQWLLADTQIILLDGAPD